jgi:hypothetical protein
MIYVSYIKPKPAICGLITSLTPFTPDLHISVQSVSLFKGLGC